MSGSITLPRVVEAMTGGLNSLDSRVKQLDAEIKALTAKREAVKVEAAAQRAAVNALLALDAVLGSDETITLRFPT